jgi:hypothetical protein
MVDMITIIDLQTMSDGSFHEANTEYTVLWARGKVRYSDILRPTCEYGTYYVVVMGVKNCIYDSWKY